MCTIAVGEILISSKVSSNKLAQTSSSQNERVFDDKHWRVVRHITCDKPCRVKKKKKITKIANDVVKMQPFCKN